MRYRAILFDLFGTVVLFKRTVPTVMAGGERWRSTLPWLETHLQTELPEVSPGAFISAIMAVTDEMVRARAPEHLEVPSRERFRRGLERLGIVGDLAALAERLSLVHMAHLADRTEVPPEHLTLLRDLAAQGYRLGLISNFDHGPTAREILRRHAVAELFEVTLISDEHGRRKPHPAIFQTALDQMNVAPGEALFVGDTIADDVYGAQAVGIDVAWINDHGIAVPEDGPAPTHVITTLPELKSKLE